MSLQHLFTRIMAAASMAMALPLLAQEAKEKTPTAAQQAMMEAWQKAATPGSNHKLLAGLTGQWTFATRMWMEPGAPPEASTGSAVYTSLMDGRFIQGEYTGTFGGMAFQGLGLTGYDNVAKHFTATWADNMGTAIMWVSITAWVLCFFFYLGALFFIEGDIQSLRTQMAERAKAM